MRYVVANKEKALDAGVLLLGHLVKGESIILNEKEVMCLPSLDGELEDRILLLDGGKSSVSCPLKPSDSAPLKHSTMPP